MSASHIILASLPPFCQKLSKLVEIWRSSDQNNFAVFWGTVYTEFRGKKESLASINHYIALKSITSDLTSPRDFANESSNCYSDQLVNVVQATATC